MVHTGRRAFLSVEDSYHGDSLGGLSIGASDNRERIKNLLPRCSNEGAFYSTYGWHPRSVAASIATLRNLKENRAQLLSGIAEMSEYFRVRLLQLEFDRPAAVRIQGLAIGIDVGEEDYADEIDHVSHNSNPCLPAN